MRRRINDMGQEPRPVSQREANSTDETRYRQYNIRIFSIYFMLNCCGCFKTKYILSQKKYKLPYIIKTIEIINKYRTEVDDKIRELCKKNTDTKDYSGIFTIKKMTKNAVSFANHMLIEIRRRRMFGALELQDTVRKLRKFVAAVRRAQNQKDTVNAILADLIHWMGAYGIKINLSMFWGRDDANLTEYEALISIILTIMDKQELENYEKKILLTVYYKYIMCRYVDKALGDLVEINMPRRIDYVWRGNLFLTITVGVILLLSGFIFLSVTGYMGYNTLMLDGVEAFLNSPSDSSLFFLIPVICDEVAVFTCIVGAIITLLPCIPFFIFKSPFNSSDAIKKKFSKSEDIRATFHKEAELKSEQPLTLFCRRKIFPNLNLFQPINNHEEVLRTRLKHFSEDIASSNSRTRSNYVDVRIHCAN